MNEAIQQKRDLLSRPQCVSCGETEGAKVFELNLGGDREQIMVWCPSCAREVIGVLSSAFPPELPQFVKTMQKL